MNQSPLQRNLESLEQKYIELAGSAQQHIRSLDQKNSGLQFENTAQAALISQLKEDNSQLMNLRKCMQEEISGLKGEISSLKEDAACLIELLKAYQSLAHRIHAINVRLAAIFSLTKVPTPVEPEKPSRSVRTNLFRS